MLEYDLLICCCQHIQMFHCLFMNSSGFNRGQAIAWGIRNNLWTTLQLCVSGQIISMDIYPMVLIGCERTHSKQSVSVREYHYTF